MKAKYIDVGDPYISVRCTHCKKTIKRGDVALPHGSRYRPLRAVHIECLHEIVSVAPMTDKKAVVTFESLRQTILERGLFE